MSPPHDDAIQVARLTVTVENLTKTVDKLTVTVDKLTAKVDSLEQTTTTGKAVVMTVLKIGAFGTAVIGAFIAVMTYLRG